MNRSARRDISPLAVSVPVDTGGRASSHFTADEAVESIEHAVGTREFNALRSDCEQWIKKALGKLAKRHTAVRWLKEAVRLTHPGRKVVDSAFHRLYESLQRRLNDVEGTVKEQLELERASQKLLKLQAKKLKNDVMCCLAFNSAARQKERQLVDATTELLVNINATMKILAQTQAFLLEVNRIHVAAASASKLAGARAAVAGDVHHVGSTGVFAGALVGETARDCSVSNDSGEYVPYALRKQMEAKIRADMEGAEQQHRKTVPSVAAARLVGFDGDSGNGSKNCASNVVAGSARDTALLKLSVVIPGPPCDPLILRLRLKSIRRCKRDCDKIIRRSCLAREAIESNINNLESSLRSLQGLLRRLDVGPLNRHDMDSRLSSTIGLGAEANESSSEDEEMDGELLQSVVASASGAAAGSETKFGSGPSSTQDPSPFPLSSSTSTLPRLNSPRHQLRRHTMTAFVTDHSYCKNCVWTHTHVTDCSLYLGSSVFRAQLATQILKDLSELRVSVQRAGREIDRHNDWDDF